MSNRILGPSTGLESLRSAVESEFARTRGTSEATGSEKTGAKDSTKNEKAEGLAKAAHEFESLLLAQMLRTVRESSQGNGWMGSGKAMGADSTMELAETQLAKALADNGALGLSKMLQHEMARESQRNAGVSTDAAKPAAEEQPPRFAPGSLRRSQP